MGERLQRLALRTQWPPFVWLYRGVYGLAVRFAVRWLRRIGGVRAIYLRRGLAGADPVYGLSDIDLLVLVDDGDDRAAALVRYHYDLVRQVVPMLAGGELELYSPGRLRRLHERVPFYRARLESGRETWRRLWGEDLFAHLQPSEGDLGRLAVWELAPSWHHLSKELDPRDGRPGFERRYTAYKMLADAARAAVISRGGPAQVSRREALLLGVREWPEVSEVLGGLLDWRANSFLNGRIDADRLTRAWRRLAERALDPVSETGEPTVRLRIRAPDRADLGPLLSEEDLDTVARAVAALPGIERAVLAPRLSFEQVAAVALDPIARTGATVGAFDLLLAGTEMPPARSLRRLGRNLASVDPSLVPYFVSGELATALRPARERPVLFLRHHPWIPAWLEQPAGLRPGLGLAAEVEVMYEAEPADALEARARSLLAMTAAEDACCLPEGDFFALFSEAGRAACVVASARRGRACVPVDATQVFEDLVGLAPEEADVLAVVHEECDLALRGRPSEAARYVTWSRAFARQLVELLFSADGPHATLPSPPREELSISVVVASRNRSARLRGALESLTRQLRPPDQVVVVDNASTDDTAQVARSFADRLELTLVREERIGIPSARNAGLGAATCDLVASMDDDCVADPAWLAELERPFLKDPGLGAAGGRVMPLVGKEGIVDSFFSYHQQRRAPRREGAGG